MRIEKWMFDRHLSFICFACLHCAMWCYLYLNINVAGLPKNIMILSRLGLHSFFNPPKSSISPHFLEEMSRDVKKPHGMQLTPWVFRIEFFFYRSKGKVICVKEYAFNSFETIGRCPLKSYNGLENIFNSNGRYRYNDLVRR